ncbi:hypothetical protein Barb7_01430 [Bacteroidales bacterium Barb7]|nr:hypothetical protein Barb7_01430 [Bacteroidales bacterium Barb7]
MDGSHNPYLNRNDAFVRRSDTRDGRNQFTACWVCKCYRVVCALFQSLAVVCTGEVRRQLLLVSGFRFENGDGCPYKTFLVYVSGSRNTDFNRNGIFVETFTRDGRNY